MTIKAEISHDLLKAKKSIKIAVSWLTDHDLLDILLKTKQNDPSLVVEIVLSAHRDNRKEYVLNKFRELIRQGAKIRTWGSETTEEGNFMHCKFYIIDDEFAKSGSYNWSKNATTNAECLDKVELKPKIQQFSKLINNGATYLIV